CIEVAKAPPIAKSVTYSQEALCLRQSVTADSVGLPTAFARPISAPLPFNGLLGAVGTRLRCKVVMRDYVAAVWYKVWIPQLHVRYASNNRSPFFLYKTIL